MSQQAQLASGSAIRIEIVVSRPFMENTLIVWRDGHRECLVVDPGLEPAKVIRLIEQEGLTPVTFLMTHGHADHIGGNFAMKKRWPEVPIVIGVNEAHLLTDAIANLSGLTGASVTSPPADQVVHDLEVISVAGMTFLVREIPGHSPGHVVYILQESTPTLVLGGDVLFQGSIGRTDFPGGDLGLLLSGIREKLFCLADDTIVFPGHGPQTTIGIEKVTNPFCGERAGTYDFDMD